MREHLRVPHTSTRGRLLVATPDLDDPNFARTVVLVLEHRDEGALGVVLNRPAGVPVADALPVWERTCASPAQLFVGGPVQRDSVLALGRRRAVDEDPDGFMPLFDGLGTLDLEREPEGFEMVRIFVGYAGWASGQLDRELAAGGWLLADHAPDDIATADPGGLWRGVLRRQGGRMAMFALAPDDPSTN
jgi:putative transcriptional regulator